MTSSLTSIDHLPRKESSTTSRLTGTPFALFTLLTRGFQALKMILPLLLLSSPMKYFLAWNFIFLLLTGLVRKIPLIPRNGSDFKPNTQELLSSSHAILSPKPLKMPNHLLSNASTTKSLTARLVLAPIGLWPKLSPKTFANHISIHQKTNLSLFPQLFYPRTIFSHQSLPPTPTWTTKMSNLLISPIQNSLCLQLSSPHEKSAKPFSSFTPPNPKALMVFQQ